MTVDAYVRKVLDHYLSLPDTPERPRRQDRALARSLFSDHMPLSTVLNAMLLATVRRHYRDSALPPLEPVRSLNYFLPVIRYLKANPPNPTYVDYLTRMLEGIPGNSLPNERTTP